MNPEYPFQPPQQPAQQPYQSAPQQQPQPQVGYGAPAPQQPPVRRSDPGKKWVIMTFVFIFTTLVMGGLAIWALINYFDQKDNVDSKVSSAVSLAVKEQRAKDAEAAAEKEKEPNRLFVGPDDYGRVSFEYPKTWSVYEESDANSSGDDYIAYFNPGVIPPASEEQRYALRLLIEDRDYDEVIDRDYSRLVEEGELKSSSVTLGDQNGIRLDGNFTEDIRGSAVILKIRDKTVTLRTDASTFTKDFEQLITTLTFNK